MEGTWLTNQFICKYARNLDAPVRTLRTTWHDADCCPRCATHDMSLFTVSSAERIFSYDTQWAEVIPRCWIALIYDAVLPWHFHLAASSVFNSRLVCAALCDLFMSIRAWMQAQMLHLKCVGDCQWLVAFQKIRITLHVQAHFCLDKRGLNT